MPILHPTSDVRCREVDGLIVMLDLRTGVYVVLDRVATAMWHALTTVADTAMQLAELERRFEAPADRLEADLAAFARDCCDRGFLGTAPSVEEGPASVGRHRSGALVLRAWLALFATTRALARRDFPDTYRRYARLPRPAAGAEGPEERVARALRAFSRAENFFLIRSAPRDCLPRSLALYRFLLSVGVPAEHCIGVRRFPFEAHAWVECRGRVVHDSRGYTGGFTELARLR